MKFQDPPKTQRSKHPHYEIAAELRAHPNQWALVFENTNPTYQQHIKSGFLAAYRPAGSFESRSASKGAGKFDIYARYVGGVDA